MPEHKIKNLLTEYNGWLGYDPPAWGKETAGAKRLLDAGYSHEEIHACYEHFKADKFWKGKHLSLAYISSNIAAWKQEYGEIETDLDKWYHENN